MFSYISVFSSSGSVYLQMSERKAYFSGLSFSSCNVFFLLFLFAFWLLGLLALLYNDQYEWRERKRVDKMKKTVESDPGI